MSMLLIGVLVLLIGGAAWGIYRGFLLIAYSLLAWIVSFVIVSCAAPALSQNIIEGTDLDEQIQESITFQLKGNQKKEGAKDASKSEKVLEVAGIRLPETIASKLGDPQAMGEEALSQMGVYDQIAAMLTRALISGGSFLIVLLIVRGILVIVGHVLKIVSKIQGIKQVNKVLGAVLGFAEGLLIVWLMFAVVAFVSTTETGKQVTNTIYRSPLLTLIYNNNPITAFVGNFL